VPIRVRLPTPPERATCATCATSLLDPAETLKHSGRAPQATSVRPDERGPGRTEVANRARPPNPSIHAGFRPQVAQVAQVARVAGDSAPANDDGDPLEPVGVLLDDDGDPALPCATCGTGTFHRPPGDRWRCSACEPPTLPADAAAMAGWRCCGLRPENGPPGALQSRQGDDSGSGHARAEAATADALPGGFPVPADDGPPDPATAPIGRCSACRWLAPLRRGVCWACETGGPP
jgi:hypothetical protein